MTAASDDRVFFGHPRGLAYLAFTEAWERFSYYGMTSLVVLYMVQQLFLPGHVEHVAGLATVRGLLGLGPGVADQALASIIFGWYSGLVRSEEHTSELQSLMRISYAVFCLKKKQKHVQTAN